MKRDDSCPGRARVHPHPASPDAPAAPPASSAGSCAAADIAPRSGWFARLLLGKTGGTSPDAPQGSAGLAAFPTREDDPADP